jgi:hypothetical protein
VIAVKVIGNQNVYLHIWGGGLDRYVLVVPLTVKYWHFPDPPGETHNYYFAQLVDTTDPQTVLSKKHQIETYAHDKDGCSMNLISMVFEKER